MVMKRVKKRLNTKLNTGPKPKCFNGFENGSESEIGGNETDNGLEIDETGHLGTPLWSVQTWDRMTVRRENFEEKLKRDEEQKKIREQIRREMADTKAIKEYQEEELRLKNKSSKSCIEQEGKAPRPRSL